MAFKGPVQPCWTASVVDIASAIRGRGRAENVHGLIAKGIKVPGKWPSCWEQSRCQDEHLIKSDEWPWTVSLVIQWLRKS